MNKTKLARRSAHFATIASRYGNSFTAPLPKEVQRAPYRLVVAKTGEQVGSADTRDEARKRKISGLAIEQRQANGTYLRIR